MKKIIARLLEFETKYKLNALREVAIFMLITIVVHFLYRLWANHYDHRIFGFQVITPGIFDFFSDLLFYPSQWVNKNILGLHFVTEHRDMFFYSGLPAETHKPLGWIGVYPGCSGLKQFLQFSILMMIYPGPWKKKLWFIPLGLFFIYLTNILRIVGLSFIIAEWSNQNYYDLSHDYIFRPFFYVVIFGLWVYWVEKIKKIGEKNT